MLSGVGISRILGSSGIFISVGSIGMGVGGITSRRGVVVRHRRLS